jgi:HK97 family phage prohead protease/HK97 family phage major capsid protein
MYQRAYAQLEVKSLETAGDVTIVTGIASTPTPDVEGHSVDPAGVTFVNPIPLLLYHDKTAPVGRVWLARQGDAITFRAELPHVAEPGVVRDRVQEAITSLKAGLLSFVSIGFLPLKDGAGLAIKRLASGVVSLAKTKIFELSLVTVPANSDATILTVKALDAPHLAAAGPHPPGVAGRSLSIGFAMTNQEAITLWENKRAATMAAASALMTKANEAGVALEGDEATTYDERIAEVTTIDAQLVRLRHEEKLNVKAATPITPGAPRPAIVTLGPKVAPGAEFAAAVICLARARGDKLLAIEYAKEFKDFSPNVELWTRAAVTPATTQDPNWAGNLVPAVQNVAGGFLDLLRPGTILGKIDNLYRVPFNSAVPLLTNGGSVNWVGEGKPKPVTKGSLDKATLEMAKAAAIVPLTDELVRRSDPNAIGVVQRMLIGTMTQFADAQFIDPAVAYVANVHPASITNGVTPIAAATPADPSKDIQALFAAFAAANLPIGGLTVIMSETNALAMAMARTNQGVPVFPNLGVTGGTLPGGVKVITSNTAGSNVIGLAPEYILYADEGVVFDVSREASIQMNDAPDDPVAATTVLVSLWQQNMVAVRVERYMNWKRGRIEAVHYVNGAAY